MAIFGNKNYDILELKPGATREDIKRAYRRLAHQHHPDKHGDPEKFKEITAAYKALMENPQTDPFTQGFTQQYTSNMWQQSQNFNMNFDDIMIDLIVTQINNLTVLEQNKLKRKLKWK
jgi:DnaJ-class molecular chaperone